MLINDDQRRKDLKKKIWIDLLNPSHPLFFHPLVKDLKEHYSVEITIRKRGETAQLARKLGLEGELVGKDMTDPIRKTLWISARTIQLFGKVGNFDWALSLENPMSVAVSKMRSRKSILILDNDLKLKIKGNIVQSLESRVKFGADHIIVPEACRESFERVVPAERLHTYDGFKEDFYISTYEPDPGFMENLPFSSYVVVRPEALASFYVKEKRTIVPELVDSLLEEGLNVVYLPREGMDRELVKGKDVFIPESPLNGLDLAYHSFAVLTGSGTMSREAAVMGRPAVSFFPGDALLSVDESMIGKGWVLHSREPDEIVGYLKGLSRRGDGVSGSFDRGRSLRVREELATLIRSIIDG